MNEKLYKLMAWPEIEDITYGECEDPFKLLGGHITKEGFLIQVYRPDAVEVYANVSIKDKKYQFEKVDESGYFAVIIPTKRKIKYTLTVETIDGKLETYTDMYSFDRVLTDAQVKSVMAGNCHNLREVLGNHQCQIEGVSGTHFAVWAPEANGVGVSGDFNGWNGKRAQMRKLDNSHIWEIFIPEVLDGAVYKYEVRGRNGKAVQKSDPVGLIMEQPPFSGTVVGKIPEYKWCDSKWMDNRDKSDNASMPLSIYEMNLCDLKSEGKFLSYKELAENVCTVIKKMHYTHVELMGVCEYLKDDGLGIQTTGLYAPTARYGRPEEFCQFIDELHRQRIGVIMDWNCAFIPDDITGLSMFSGSKQYEMFKTRIDRYNGVDLYTYDYTKPQVVNFLLENAKMWMETYHIDGLKVIDVSTMLYLDYGKNPGEWIPNIYGGNENFAAIEFLRKLNTLADKENVFTIAQDESAWETVTGKPCENCLGFDFKWNEDFSNELLSFMETDPLFRNGQYGKFVNTMLYNYKENFMLELSHLHFMTKEPAGLMAAPDETMKKASIRLMYGYMYMHPGKKTVYGGMERKDECLEKYFTELNKFYITNPALYEADYDESGFKWINDSDAQYTVTAFQRCSSKGQKLLVVANFTPVLRENYILGVPDAGKYVEIFNSDKALFGGSTVTDKNLFKSEEYRNGMYDNQVELTLPPLGLVVYEYVPYTEIEQKEIEIIRDAKRAKSKAEEEARIAESLKIKAEEEAAAAVEAEKKAKNAALAALAAKEEAEKKAEDALALSKRIDKETQKKLDELHGRKVK